jgi:thiol-disulfide isomerase/thioredoxin
MKKVLLTLFAIISFSVSSIAQYFTLKGNTGDAGLDSVSIQYINRAGKIIQESVAAVGGRFTLSGLISQPTFSYLLFKPKGQTIGRKEVEQKRNAAYLDPGAMTISKVPLPGGYLHITGSKTQEEWKTYWDKTKALTGKQLAQASYDYFIQHTDSYITSDRIKYFTSAFSLDSIKAVYQKYSKAIKESTDGRRLAAEIKSREAGQPGTAAFAFEVKDKDDQLLSLTGMKGKYVLLDFWATWCVPCRASMPHMISLYQKYKAKDFVMIGIGDDDKNRKNWLAAIEKDGTGLWPQALRGLDAQLFMKGFDNPNDLSQQYGVRALPTKILIDPGGQIIGRYDGQHSSDADLDRTLESLFK